MQINHVGCPKRHLRDAARLRLGSSLAVLAIVTTSALVASSARAAEFTAANETELRNAIAAAAASPDASSTITLTAPIVVSNSPFTDLNGKSVTIVATGANTLSAVDGTNPGSSIVFAPATGASALTIVGNVQGGDSPLGNVAGGDGLVLTGVTITNNGTIVGGAAGNPTNTGAHNNGSGQGLDLVNGTLINNGTITGSGGTTLADGTNVRSGIGVVITGGTGHINNGTIGGGLGASANASAPGLDMLNATLTNNGTIRGGGPGGSNGDGAWLFGTSTIVNNEGGEIYGNYISGAGQRGGEGITVYGLANATIINHGLIRGSTNSGTGSSWGIAVEPLGGAGGTIRIVNSGTIAAGQNGTGDRIAINIDLGSADFETVLELQAGSVIDGLVRVEPARTNTLILGGTDDDDFGVAAIGTTRQYRGFDIFEKRGLSTWTITGVADGQAAPWDIYEGTLLMSAGSDLGNGPVDVFGGTLAGIGIVGATTHHANGTIAPGIDGTGTLTVDGAYTGAGGLLTIETVLGDDNSETDLLAINGGTSGSTFVRVTNVGGAGAQTQEGIKIVDFDADDSGNESSSGIFSLLGDTVVNGQQAVLGGAFAYSLYQGSVSDPTDGDWYLRSIGFTPSATAYESYPGVLLGLIDMPTLQQRVGNIYMPNAGSRTDSHVNAEPTADVVGEPSPPPANFWTRIEAATGHHEGDSDTGTEYDLDRYKVQAGIDGRLGESEDGILIAGINAQYGHANADLESDTGDGENSTDSYGGGLTLVWVGVTGFYADAQAMVHYLESDLSSDVVGDLVDNNEGWGYGLSLELGRKIALDDAVSLTPQAQLYYTSVDFDDFTDELGVDVSLDEGESLKGRLGVALGFDSYDSGESRGHVYAIANVTYEFLNAQSVDVAGVDVEFEPEDWGGELGLGGTYEWAGGTYAIHGEALGQTSFAESYGVKGTAGFSMRF